MKNERLLNIIGEIDDKYIEEASPEQKKKQNRKFPWIKCTAVAAGVIIAATAVSVPLINRNTAVMPNDSTVRSDSNNSTAKSDAYDPNRYKDFSVMTSSPDRIFDGEYWLISEKYKFFYLGDRRYEINSRYIDEKWIEKPIGECDTLRDNNEVLTAYKIKGVDERLLVAAGYDKEKFVYSIRIHGILDGEFDTLGKLFEACDLPSMAELNCFNEYEGRTETGYYDLKNGEEIWQILSEFKDAKYADVDLIDTLTSKKYISFIVSSEPLGIYKRSMGITEDGYLITDIFTSGSWGYIYDIGEETAQRIISLAKSNSEKGTEEPYYYSLIGTVTEVGDGYILIDDSVICKDPNNGITFKVLTDKLIMKREIEFWHIEEGRTVLIEYKYKADSDNLIDSAVSLNLVGIKDGKLNSIIIC